MLRYREKPSTMLAELESFMDAHGIGIGQHRREIAKAKEKEVDLLREIVEDDPDFPGWDYL